MPSSEIKPFPEKTGGVIYHCIGYVIFKLPVINQLDAVLFNNTVAWGG